MLNYCLYILILSTTASCVYILLTSNTFKIIISLFVITIGVSFILILLGSTFVGISYLIVYVSVILSFIAFGIMLEGEKLIQTGKNLKIDVTKKLPTFVGVLICSGSFILISRMVIKILDSKTYPEVFNEVSVKKIGFLLIIKHIIPFEVISLILLGVIIGVIAINKI